MGIELNMILLSIQSKCLAGVGGVTVSMVAFQAVDPGSIPGRRILVAFLTYSMIVCLMKLFITKDDVACHYLFRSPLTPQPTDFRGA